jgi:transcriptional regulator with XRE-family HTH domain
MRAQRTPLVDADVGTRLRKAANEAGITLRELGERLNVSRPTIYAYASGTLRVPDSRLERLSEILGKPTTYFRPASADDLDPSSEARQALNLIEALMAPPDPERALETALTVIQQSDEARNPGIRAEFLRRAGNARALTGDHLGALRNLDDALHIFAAAGREEDAARCSQTLGLCYIALGRLETAEECFRHSERCLPAGERWKGTTSLASLAERRGDYGLAEAKLSSLVADDGLPWLAQVYVRATYASMTCTRGFWRSGLALSEAALGEATEAGATDQVNELMIAVARAYTALGRYDEAWTMHVRAQDVATSLRDQARLNYNAAARAQLAVRLADHKAARDEAVSVLATSLERQHLRAESLARLVLAEASLALGSFSEAQAHAVQAKVHSTRNAYPVAFVQASALLAFSYLAAGDPGSGLAEAQAAEPHSEGLGEAKAMLLAAQAACLRGLGKDHEAERQQALAEAAAGESGIFSATPWNTEPSQRVHVL